MKPQAEKLNIIQSLLYIEDDALLQKVKKLLEGYMPSFEKKKKGAKKHSARKAGSMKGLVTFMAKDFDAPLDDFKEYM